VRRKKVDRRKVRFRAFRLGQPFFMQVPKPLAATLIAGCALVAIFASQAAPTVAFGPFFLLICALGAWLVGNRYAVLIGLFIVTIQIMNGHAVALDGQPLVRALQFCSALAVVLMLGVARDALELEWRYARIDPLTGALNRKAFFEAANGEAGRAGITVLVYVDVDQLKRLNDRLGHEAGDVALFDFADRVRKAIRKEDVFARMGGDEFVILMKVGDTASAELVAQRLNTALNLDPLAGETSLKCSMGVLVLPTGSRSIDAELKQADTLMYYAKKERSGLMMAISIKGEMEELLSSAPSANSHGQQRAAVRSTERPIEFAANDHLPPRPITA